jgi:NADPH:quinone reductase-like Zn-dependent oxidoreductase
VIGVTVFPIHRSDVQQIADATVRASGATPRPVGLEVTGVIEAVGFGVSRLREGMRVSVFPHRGTWAQRILVDADAVLPVPDSVPEEVAARSNICATTVTSEASRVGLVVVHQAVYPSGRDARRSSCSASNASSDTESAAA